MSKQEDNRVAELEARIVQLETELASLRPSPKPARKHYVEEGARIIQHGPAFIQPDDFPKQSELDSLLRIVLNAYPKLAADTHEYKYNFDRAFLSLCHIRRRSDIDKQNRMSYWRDHAQDILSSLHIPASLDLAPFIAATIAHGDIMYTHPYHELNFSMSAGLFFGGGTEGKAYSGAWRRLLEVGHVNPPVEIVVPKNVMSHNVRIVGGDWHVGQQR